MTSARARLWTVICAVTVPAVVLAALASCSSTSDIDADAVDVAAQSVVSSTISGSLGSAFSETTRSDDLDDEVSSSGPAASTSNAEVASASSPPSTMPMPSSTTEPPSTKGETSTILPSGFTIGVTTIHNGVGKTVITGPLPVDDSPPLATELVVDVSVDPSVDTTGIDIEGAIEAYRGFLDIADRALNDPGKAWSEEIYRFSVDPAAQLLADDVAFNAQNGTYSVGHTLYDALVIKASATKALLHVCLDNRGHDIRQVGVEGSIRAGVGSAYLQSATVIRQSDEKWYVSDVGAKVSDRC